MVFRPAFHYEIVFTAKDRWFGIGFAATATELVMRTRKGRTLV